MRLGPRLSLVLIGLALGACGEQQPANPPTAPGVKSAQMTRRIPARLSRVCASAERKGTVPVSCPRLIPEGTRSSSVLQPRRSVVRPGAPGDDGRRRFRGLRDYYVIEAYARSLKEAHWLTGAGTARSLEEHALRSSVAPGVERVRVAGQSLELRRYPLYPDGGINGGHVLALVRDGARIIYVSVHGYEHKDVAIAMLVELTG